MASASPTPSNGPTALSDEASLNDRQQGQDQGGTLSCGDGTKRSAQLVGELSKPSMGHQDLQHETPKKLRSGAMLHTSDNDLSPASTFGTTLSGGESVPATPLSPHFSSQELNSSFTTVTDETDDVSRDDKRRNKFRERLVAARCATKAQGDGVFLTQGKSDSCPDRLASMVHSFELDDRSESSRSSDSLVTKVRKDVASSVIEASSTGEVDNHLAESPSVATNDTPVTAEKAQSIYPPEASVFVANLAKDRTDEELLRPLKELFGKFGESWILIRRDSSNAIPFAFVQYKTKEEAQAALEETPGKFICGRPCRVEASRAHRAVYITRKDGKEPSIGEVNSLLNNYKTTEIWSPTKTEIEAYGLGNGIWVRFELFGECKDAVKALRNDQSYHLIYKDFDRRRKTIKHRGPQNANRHWKPGPQNVLSRRNGQVRTLGSPYMSNAIPATINMHHGNASWYSPYANLTSVAPLPPMISYGQATGQAVMPTMSANGAMPLLQQHSQIPTAVSGPAFTAPNVYAAAHQPTYPQSPLSPISLSHDQFFFSGQPVSPVSPHGMNGTATTFPAFHAQNVAGNMVANNMYVPATHFTPAHASNIFNAPYTTVGPLEQHTSIHGILPGPTLCQHPNCFPVTTAPESYSGPSTQARENTSSPFRDQLPEGYRSHPTLNHRPTHVSAGPIQQNASPSPTSFGFDGTWAVSVPTQQFSAQALVPGADGKLVAVTVPMKVESVAVEFQRASATT